MRWSSSLAPPDASVQALGCRAQPRRTRVRQATLRLKFRRGCHDPRRRYAGENRGAVDVDLDAGRWPGIRFEVQLLTNTQAIQSKW